MGVLWCVSENRYCSLPYRAVPEPNVLVPAKEVNEHIVVSFLCLETTMSRSPSPPPLYAHRKEWEDVQPIAQHDEGTNPVAQIFYSEACTFCFSSLIVRRSVFGVDAMCDLPLSLGCGAWFR